ncbi:MAG: glycosyltransferase family 4 protein [Methylococcaceae bacterium]
MSAPKILFFVTEDWFVCSHWLPHISAAHAEGYEVYVLTRVSRHQAVIEARGATVIPLPIQRSSRNPLRELQLLVRIIRVYRDIRPDLVQHIAMKPVIYGTLAARFMGRKSAVVNYVAGLGWLFTATSAMAQLTRLPLTLALRVVLNQGHVIVENPNDYAQVSALGVPDAQLTQVPGAGVDMTEFSPTEEPPGPPLILMACRMLWAKGVGEFVKAAQLFRERGLPGRFVLAGSPDDENPSSVPFEQLETWRRDGVVEWWGRCDDMPSAFAQASIVCLPTAYGEGVPKVLIEAAAAGRPIVATQIPGCREIVRDGDNGLLVPIHDAEALAQALATLADNQALRQRMGRRGRAIALADFSVQEVIVRVMALYRSLLA